jgi:hypothetical protein
LLLLQSLGCLLILSRTVGLKTSTGRLLEGGVGADTLQVGTGKIE